MFEFLWILASQDGELAGKNELMDQLWPQQYVTEASLSRLVSEYYNNSLTQSVSFFSESSDLDQKELEEAMKMLEDLKKRQDG